MAPRCCRSARVDVLTYAEDGDWIEEQKKLRAWLLPQTPHFFFHNGQKLHVRHWFPASTATLHGTIFYIHGLNAHINGPGLAKVAQALVEAGYAVLALDLPGNGYSEGLRSYVKDFEEVFSTCLRFIAVVIGEAQGEGVPQTSIGVPEKQARDLWRVPFFLLGNSMGGLLAMYVSLRLTSTSWRKRHHGTILVAPALAVDLPSRAVVLLLQTMVVPIMGKRLMPEGVSKSSKPKPELIIRNPEDRAAHELDDWHRFPGVGLAWKQRMRWATAGAFSSLFLQIDSSMKQVACPLLVMHDPDDQICLIKGSQHLMEVAASSDKTLIEADGAMHGILANEFEWSLAQILKWLKIH